MKVLIACEESQRVCTAFREKGHEAYSCDIIDCSGGHPEWHIKQDVLPLLNGYCIFKTQNGITHTIIGEWDMIIAHPPCTYLSNVATRSFSLKCNDAKFVIDRWKKRAEAAIFFMYFVTANCKCICVENPVGFMNTAYKKPEQIIEPYQFVEDMQSDEYVTKRTCLWLKGLPILTTNDLPRPNNHKQFGTMPSGKARTWEDTISRRADIRSKTFYGIAKAMAEQWG